MHPIVTLMHTIVFLPTPFLHSDHQNLAASIATVLSQVQDPSSFDVHFQTIFRHSLFPPPCISLFYFLPAISNQHQINIVQKIFYTTFSCIGCNFITYHHSKRKRTKELRLLYFYSKFF